MVSGMKTRHQSLDDLRVDAVRQVEAGGDPETVAAELRISLRTLYRWMAAYREHGEQSLVTGEGSRSKRREPEPDPLTEEADAYAAGKYGRTSEGPGLKSRYAVWGLSALLAGMAVTSKSSAWTYLLLAGVCEMGWPVGFKLSQQVPDSPEFKLLAIAGAIVSMALSVWLLWLAQRDIPIGTAYAVWTGIGGVGTFLIGVAFFGDGLTLMRALGVVLIIGGVIVLKLSN
jgi:quaternary ammonium compound-resistance protein SugE